MKKPHAGFWLATLGLGVCWLLALLTRDRLNGILLAGAALALILPRRPPQRRGPGCLGWHRHGWALELQRRAALQRATRPAALGHRALDRLRLLVVLAAGRGQSGPWPLAVLGAAVGPFAYAVSWKLDALLPDVPPEFMLLLLAVGWSIYLPAVSWLQWKQQDS